MHRDISLENFRVDDDGQVKLINFGLLREILAFKESPFE